MSNWNRWDRGNGMPYDAVGFVDVKYIDGKEFYRKWAKDVYWGFDSLIEYWREA